MKGRRSVLSWIAVLLVVSAVAGAQERPAQPRAQAAAATMPPHVQAAYDFLLAWGHGNWAEARAVAADTVVVTLGETLAVLDVAGGKGAAVLVFPFKGLSTVREGGQITAISVDELTVKVAERETTGVGRLALEERAGRFVVTEVTVE